jgi:Holliday junction resolvase RusA-like endonuclease
VFLDPKYAAWRNEFQALCYQHGWHKKPVRGKFKINVTLDRRSMRGDIDNRMKAILDALHINGITDDDRHCERICIERGEAPLGCKVEVEAI